MGARSDIEALSTRHDSDAQSVVDRLIDDRDALARLVEEHRVFKEAIERSPVAYCVYDADDRLIAFNAAYSKLHGGAMLSDSVRGQPIRYADLVRAEIAEHVPAAELDAAVAQRVREQRSADGRSVTRKYGEFGYFRLTKYPLSNGAVAGLAFDVNELKTREAELTRANAEAKEASLRAEHTLEQERLRKQEARLLSELGEWLQSCKSLQEIYRIIGRFMAQMFPTTAGELYIYSNSRDTLDLACSWRRSAELAPHFQPDECWALRRGRMYRFGHGMVNFLCGHVHDADPDDAALGYLCIPINAHGDTVGMLHIRSLQRQAGNDPATLDAELHTFALQCSEQISLAIANVKLRDELREQSTRDPLTGLYNRRYYFERYRLAINQAARTGGPLGVISLDADNFKRMNDTFGHDAGDVVLRRLGELLSQLMVGDAVAARLGGEEFSVLLPGCTLDETAAQAELLRQAVERLSISHRELQLPRLTVSVGLSVYPDGGTTMQELLKSADLAMYDAKEAGRNCVRTRPERKTG